MAAYSSSEGATPTVKHGLGFVSPTSDLSHSRDPSSRAASLDGTPLAMSTEFQQSQNSDALAFARRILSSPSSETLTRSRTTSSSSITSAEYAYQQFSPEAGPSSPPRSSSSTSTSGGPPQLPPRRRSNRGSSGIERKHNVTLSASSGHRQASFDASAEKQALAKLVGMYENLVSHGANYDSAACSRLLHL